MANKLEVVYPEKKKEVKPSTLIHTLRKTLLFFHQRRILINAEHKYVAPSQTSLESLNL